MASLASSPFPSRTPLTLVVLAALLGAAACGGDAESAQDEASVPVPEQVAEAPAEPVPPTMDDRLVPDATEKAEAAAPPAAAPAPRPQPRPAAPRPQPSAPAEPSTPQPVVMYVPAGTTVEATIDAELATDKNRAGDRFFATLADDLLAAGGEVLIPAGATLNGRVVESTPSPSADQPAILAVEIESITSGGRTLPVTAELVELEAEVQAKDSNSRTAAKVGVGAAAGALIGRILGNDGKDAAKGAVAGAAAGAAVAVATRDGQAVVKPGARLVVRLSERLVVEER